MIQRRTQVACVWALLLALLMVRPVDAVHESTGTLVFAPVSEAGSSGGRGDGVIDYRGGDHTTSRWTATFRFEGLTPGASYTVAVQGRFGADGTPEASEFSEICTFDTDNAGGGGCWYYFVVLERLATVDLRSENLEGPTVLQATRGDGPGSIVSDANWFTPPSVSASLAATPAATPADAGR